MSAYENVVGGKLKLKGKALDVKAGGIKKKMKKKQKKSHEQVSQTVEDELPPEVENKEEEITGLGEEIQGGNKTGKLREEEDEEEEGKSASFYDNLTAAERRYIEQREQIDTHRMAKEANKSHRDRIQDFNQYLANMSEHYDIPKVGPG
ncbi:uncharacterized protein [Euphorbia lathyris]|uniref:uncharacterized protein n=1 Tax=Euphorbia lathyris TaxID=212925 RepID=UPI0033132741